MLLIQLPLPLQIARQVIVIGKVKALTKVLLDFLDNFVDLLTILLLLLLVGFRCFSSFDFFFDA